MDLDRKQIFGKDVYIFEDHATAVEPWSEVALKIDKKPYLITLDHHTDTHPAFLRNAYNEHGTNMELCNQHREFLYKKVKLEGHKSVSWALPLLKNDEHIDFAIRAGIISHSFSIQRSNDMGTPSDEKKKYDEHIKKHGGYLIARHTLNIKEPRGPALTYSVPEDKMFIVPHVCAIGCNKGPHDDECLILHADQAIESIYLRDQLCKIRWMNAVSKLGRLTTKSPPYILDIDLDYFRTKKAIAPKDTTVFYKLIKYAAAITIATEPSCVKMLRLEKSLNSEFLLSSLLKHIEIALST